MNTCSNCGAAVRPGAKFCTACGTRLNDVSASTASSAWTSGQPNVARAPSDTDASPESEGARADPPAADAPSSSDPAPAPSTSEEASSDASSSWSWRSSPDPSLSTPVTDDGDDGEDVTIEPSSEEPRVFIVDKRDAGSPSSSTTANADGAIDEFTWTWGTPDSQDATEDDEAETSITDAERDAANRVAAEDAPLATEPDSDLSDPIRHDQEESFDLPEDSGSSMRASTDEPEGTTSGDVSGEALPGVADDSDLELEVGTPQAVDSGSGSKRGDDTVNAAEHPNPGDEDPLDRARRLIEELRTLIPPPRLYQEEAPQAVSVPVEGLRDELESARSRSDFRDLRSALESARERPRDVDTMLEMVGRIDTMLEALDDRDRLATAVERAIDRLEPGASGLAGDT